MKAKIIEEIKAIEKQENVRILYACESGSRAWGFPSQDSDYDVRFIYIHQPEWYLSIFDKRDVIERPIHDLLDINGWDLQKALRLFQKSNPSLLEWLQSPIQYVPPLPIIQELQAYVDRYFSPKPLMHHYLNMAKGNYRKGLQGEKVKSKKYFYILRPILAAMWIERFKSMPPMEFERLLTAVIPQGKLMNEIESLLARKKAGDELDVESRIPFIDDFIVVQLDHLEEKSRTLKEHRVEKNTLDQLFFKALKITWE